MTQSAVAAPGFVEEVEIHGHIIDSLILPKVLDEILTHGGSYVLKEIRIGQRPTDPSHARIEVRAPSAAALKEILDTIHDHGAVPVTLHDCAVVAADMDGAFPEGFYSTTNYRTQIRLHAEWIDVEDQEMDCGILVDPEGGAARCLAMAEVRKTREIYRFQGVQIHLDVVERLGKFIEFEKILDDESERDDGLAQLEGLRRYFQIADEDLMTSSYSDFFEPA